jgi:hypothetical protein
MLAFKRMQETAGVSPPSTAIKNPTRFGSGFGKKKELGRLMEIVEPADISPTFEKYTFTLD